MSPGPKDAAHLPSGHSEPSSRVPAKARERAELIRASGGAPRFYTSKHGTVSVMDVSRIGRRSITDSLESCDPLVRLLGEMEARGYSFESLAPEAAVLHLIDKLIERVCELEAPLIARGSPRKLTVVK